MTWYVVSIDAYGADHFTTSFDHRPTDAEYAALCEIIGYYDGGVYEADSEADAIRMALVDFVPGAIA